MIISKFVGCRGGGGWCWRRQGRTNRDKDVSRLESSEIKAGPRHLEFETKTRPTL